MKITIFFLLFLTTFFGTAQAQNESIISKEKNFSNAERRAEEKFKTFSTDQSNNQQQSGYTRPDAEKRFKRYVNNAVGPVALGVNALTAGITTAANRPEEWGKKWDGFGRRFASNMGKNIIKQTVIYSMDEAFKLDSGFYRSEKRSVGARLKNAVISPFTARKPNGKRVLGVPRIVGTYASSVIAAEVWFPGRFDYKDGLRNGSISLGVNVLVNLFQEFVWKK